jgi:hypothetical protein
MRLHSSRFFLAAVSAAIAFAPMASFAAWKFQENGPHRTGTRGAASRASDESTHQTAAPMHRHCGMAMNASCCGSFSEQ